MSNLCRLAGPRLIGTLTRYPRKDQLVGGLARYSAVPTPPTGNPPPPPPPEDGPPSQPPKSKRGIMLLIGSAVAVGGLGYAYKVYTDEDVACAEKNDAVCDTGPTATAMQKSDKEAPTVSVSSDVEGILAERKSRAMEATEGALKSYCEAADLVKQFMDKAYCAIEEDSLESPRFEEVWCEVFDLAVKRCEKVKEAIQKGQGAWELLCKLREAIDNDKDAGSPMLSGAEDALDCAQRELLNAKAKMECVQAESRLVEQYRNLIEDFRRDLKAEVDSLLTRNPECKSTLTENECSMILTHAYKKILSIQKELALLQAITDDMPDHGVEIELNPDTKALMHKKLNDMKKHYESELVKALARQSRVYQDNIELHRDLMKADYERKLKQSSDILEAEQLVDIRYKYKKATAALAAMRNVLTDRRDQEERAQNSRKLWSASSSLYNRINFASSGDPTSVINTNKAQLLEEFANDEFALQLLKTIPDKLGSIEELRNRFFDKVDKSCRKLAIFRPEEQGISLGKYIMGFFEGSFAVSCEGETEEVESIYEILDRTAFHLRRGELLEAVVILNKTEGLQRKVCQGWLADARAVLETSQTLVALMTHANAINQS